MLKTLLISLSFFLLVSYELHAQEAGSTANKTEESKAEESKEDEENKKESESDDKIYKNEVSVNAFLLFYSTIELNYERLISQKSAIGLTAGYGYAHELLNNSRAMYYWAVHPYYRFYFGKKKAASGFFLEANTGVLKESYVDDEEVVHPDSDKQDTHFFMNEGLAYGAGAALGYKRVVLKRFIAEICYGLGKNFNNNTTYSRVGVKIGSRF
ncbi:DUF3575 domain-containing protein [Pseudopedobacter beijingensis]|uniref:DUF3575 domain-containing protein n=1 Tax=Pseudopedobacter beijingensis TaxID=1207056 RepID=A0ABW4IJE1_9SPHI